MSVGELLDVALIRSHPPSISEYDSYTLKTGSISDMIETCLLCVQRVGDNMLDKYMKEEAKVDFEARADPRWHAAVAFDLAKQWGREEEKRAAASKTSPSKRMSEEEHTEMQHRLSHLFECNAYVWKAAQTHPGNTFFLQLALATDSNPFLTNPTHLLAHEDTVLSGIRPIVIATLYQYLALLLQSFKTDTRVVALEIDTLPWEVLHAAMLLGPVMEDVAITMIEQLFHVWRLDHYRCQTLQQKFKLVSYLAYTTSIQGFERLVKRMKEEAEGGTCPMLQAIALALTFHNMVSMKHMASSYAAPKLQFMIASDSIPLHRPVLFELDISKDAKNNILDVYETSVRGLTWETKTSIPYNHSFTASLVRQLPGGDTKATDGSNLQFLQLIKLIERGAPLPAASESMSSIRLVHDAYLRMIQPWNAEQRNQLFRVLVARHVMYQNIPTGRQYQRVFVRMMIDSLQTRDVITEEDQPYCNSLAGLIDMKKPSSEFSYRERLTLLAGFFRYETNRQGVLQTFFSSGVKRMSDYTEAEVIRGLAKSYESSAESSSESEEEGEVKKTTLSSSDLIKDWHGLVAEFERHVKDPGMIALWLPDGRGSDFATSLFLYALRGSNKALHPLVTYLVDHKQVTVTGYFGVKGRDERKASPVTTYSGSILDTFIRSVPKELQSEPTYWQAHQEVLRYLLEADVRLPACKNGGPEEAKHWAWLLSAFDDGRSLPSLWAMLCERREKYWILPSESQETYKEFCIRAAAVDNKSDAGDFERLLDIDIYPDDARIKVIDNSSTSRGQTIKERYLQSVNPADVGYFKKFMNAVGSRKVLMDHLLEQHKGSETQFQTAIQLWKLNKESSVIRSQRTVRTRTMTEVPEGLLEY